MRGNIMHQIHEHGQGHSEGHRHGPGPGGHHWGRGPFGRGRWQGNPGERHGFDFGERGGFWGGFGPGGPGGPGGRRERLERGLLRYIILDVLKDGPKHGYEVIKTLEERTGNQYAPSPGTLYPTLQYLDDLGLVRADQQADRKTYSLTDEGRAELEGHAEVVQHFWSRFADHTPDDVSRHELRFLFDTVHDLVRTVRMGVHTVMQGGDPDTVRRIRKALEACQNEVREIIARGTDRKATSGAQDNKDTSERQDPSEF